jgi:hypothetical protein
VARRVCCIVELDAGNSLRQRIDHLESVFFFQSSASLFILSAFSWRDRWTHRTRCQRDCWYDYFIKSIHFFQNFFFFFFFFFTRTNSERTRTQTTTKSSDEFMRTHFSAYRAIDDECGEQFDFNVDTDIVLSLAVID